MPRTRQNIEDEAQQMLNLKTEGFYLRCSGGWVNRCSPRILMREDDREWGEFMKTAAVCCNVQAQYEAASAGAGSGEFVGGGLLGGEANTVSSLGFILSCHGDCLHRRLGKMAAAVWRQQQQQQRAGHTRRTVENYQS